jgi:hypothetical protein
VALRPDFASSESKSRVNALDNWRAFKLVQRLAVFGVDDMEKLYINVKDISNKSKAEVSLNSDQFGEYLATIILKVQIKG